MVFLFESLPFELTFDILFRHGGFDSMETALVGRNVCWELLKLMDCSQRAELLCICRTVQLLDHPAHALFLLNYPPDSSIPENRRAWSVAEKCCIGWKPDVRSVVLAMRVFIHQETPRQVFPWLDTANLSFKRSESEWKAVGLRQTLCYKFNEWWWNGQREAFHLERAAAKSNMALVIRSTAMSEMERLENALKRREMCRIKEDKEWVAFMKAEREKVDVKLRENNLRVGGGGGESKEAKPLAKQAITIVLTSEDKKKDMKMMMKSEENPPKKQAIVLTSEDKKKAISRAKDAHEKLQKVLKTVSQVLKNTPVHLFDTKITKAARLVSSLEKRYPHIKWNLHLLFHIAAEETGAEVWDTEFLIQKFHRYRMEDGDLEKLKGLLLFVK